MSPEFVAAAERAGFKKVTTQSDPLGLFASTEENKATYLKAQQEAQAKLDTEYYPEKARLENIATDAEKEIAALETERKTWAEKQYKSNSATVEVGDEYSGGDFSIGSINEGRRNKRIKAINAAISDAKDRITESKKT